MNTDALSIEDAGTELHRSPDAAKPGSVVGGSLWNMISQVLPRLLTLVLSVAAARFLGPSGMGEQSFIAFAMFAMVTLLTNGVQMALMRGVAEVTGDGRLGMVRGLLRRLSPPILAGGAAGAAVLIGAGLLGAKPEAAWELAGVETLLTVAQTIPWSILAGNQLWREASVVGLVGTTIATPVTIGVLALGGGITGMFAVETVSMALSVATIGWLARRPMRRARPTTAVTVDLWQRTKRTAILGTLSTAASFVIWQRIEFVFLKVFSDNRQIAFYSIAFAAAGALAFLPSAVSATLGPAFAHLYGSDDSAQIRSSYWRAQRLVSIANLPLTAAFVALGPALLDVAYGHSYHPSGRVLLVLLALYPVLPPYFIALALLIGVGSVGVPLAFGLFGCAVTVGLNFVFVPSGHAVGAAIADVGGQAFVVVPLFVYTNRLVRPAAYDLPALLRAIAASILAGGAAWGVDHEVGGPVGLLLGALAWAAVTLPLIRLLAVIPPADRRSVAVTFGRRFGPSAEALVARVVGPGGAADEPERAARTDDDAPPYPRWALYTDGGGPELGALGELVSQLDPRVAVTVMGTDSERIASIAERCPGSTALVLPDPRATGAAGALASQLRTLRRIRPTVLHVATSTPAAGRWAVLAGLMVPGTQVVAFHSWPKSGERSAGGRRPRSLLDRLLAIIAETHSVPDLVAAHPDRRALLDEYRRIDRNAARLGRLRADEQAGDAKAAAS